MTKQLRIYNTLTGKKEAFKPIREGAVSMYACGVTTYDHYHLGHALQAIYFDVICRYLREIGYDVTYVRNYTDVDDKIIARAAEQGISPRKLADEIIASSEEDMLAIGCAKPSFSPKVSESIEDIIQMNKALIDTGAAYVTDTGDVYYSVRKNPQYGKLSNRKIDELIEGARDIHQGEKQDALDFALWKADTTKDASWPSPWGQGRPGWHIECSAMSKKHLGDHFDLHGGGRDLVFPHHENEIAQSESANGCTYANFWLHSGLLTIESQKMSKSLGNHISLKDFLKEWDPDVLRMAFLTHHYRSNIDFKKDTFTLALKQLFNIFTSLEKLEEIKGPSSSDQKISADELLKDLKLNILDLQAACHKQMSDDFNTAASLGELNKFLKQVGLFLKKADSKIPKHQLLAAELSSQIRWLLKTFGFVNAETVAEDYLNLLRKQLLDKLGVTAEFLNKRITEREAARAQKNYACSDEIRDELQALGIELLDFADHTSWQASL